LREQGVLYLQVREHIGDDDVIDGKRPLSGAPKTVEFAVETKGLQRTFYASLDGKEKEELAALQNVYYLCDEGLKRGKRFTGAMLGVFAYAGMTELWVDFTAFSYLPQM